MEKHYSRANGYEHDAQVVYGDTDSVMVLFGCKGIAKAMDLGQDAAVRISQTFLKPIKLEFEKVRHGGDWCDIQHPQFPVRVCVCVCCNSRTVSDPGMPVLCTSSIPCPVYLSYHTAPRCTTPTC